MERSEQVELANRLLPELIEIAHDVSAYLGGLRLANVPWPYPERSSGQERADYMVRSFLLFQHEHLRSAVALVTSEHHRDSSLVARTMAEGLAQLRWALKNEPRRTDQWLWYSVLLEHRVLMERRNAGRPVDPEMWNLSEKLVKRNGPRFYSEDARKALAENRPLPEEFDELYRSRWHGPKTSELFKELGDESTIFKFWQYASAWAHWSPLNVLRALDQGQGPIRYEQEDSMIAARTLGVASHCSVVTLRIATYRFGLPHTEAVDHFLARLYGPRGETWPPYAR